MKETRRKGQQEDRFRCDECRVDFETREDMERHNRQMHGASR